MTEIEIIKEKIKKLAKDLENLRQEGYVIELNYDENGLNFRVSKPVASYNENAEKMKEIIKEILADRIKPV